MLRFSTAGESHGESLIALISGLPAGVEVDQEFIDHELWRRQRGYGRGGYGALYAITPDWHPILDRLPGIEGAYCAAGFSGHGFKLSPIVGQLMAELVVDGQAKTLDVTALRLARFEEQDLVKTPYSYGVMG